MARRTSRSKEVITQLDFKARTEGPRKKFSLQDLKNIAPLTEAQRSMFHSYFEGNNLMASGSAGTGKSFVALYLALTDVLDDRNKDIDKIVLVRSAVPSREIGHLPGDIHEKTAIYEQPYKDILATLLRKSEAYETMKDIGKLEFMTTSFVRGLTWDNAVVILDEAQNCNMQEIHSVMTRIGENTRVILCGDISQADLVYRKNDMTGFNDALRIMRKMKNFDIIDFHEQDIVRSRFVKEWIMAKQSI